MRIFGQATTLNKCNHCERQVIIGALHIFEVGIRFGSAIRDVMNCDTSGNSRKLRVWCTTLGHDDELEAVTSKLIQIAEIFLAIGNYNTYNFVIRQLKDGGLCRTRINLQIDSSSRKSFISSCPLTMF